ncbi:MAG TPA: aldo/keto reductase [Gemmatimonadaceae bacterium]|nr:aldo/keto reductase [Gemmatimonadaceae bacterium]
MRYRRFGRTGWNVSEVGYGMWGMGSWSGSSDDQSMESLQLAVDLGCNFFDTAWGYGEGRSERLLGQLVRANPGRTLYTATKIPPKNRHWPSHRGDPIAEVFPPDYIREYAERSLENIGTGTIDLLQFHVWEDAWAHDRGWRSAMDALRAEGLVRSVGVSVNRWEPANVLETLKTGAVDAVQVIYNIFDQSPKDELFPLCRDLDIAVIARVPFDEGSLTGALTKESRWPAGDFRSLYFVPENLEPTVDRVEALRPLVPAGSSMADLALRFILANPDVDVVIPGMRRPDHVRANIAASDADPLSDSLMRALAGHRWDRKPTSWSH